MELGHTPVREPGRAAGMQLRRHRIPLDPFGGREGPALWPKYVWLRAYRRDKCLRSLKGPQQKERNIVFLAEWVSRGMTPILVKHPREILRRVRVLWYDDEHWDNLKL